MAVRPRTRLTCGCYVQAACPEGVGEAGLEVRDEIVSRCAEHEAIMELLGMVERLAIRLHSVAPELAREEIRLALALIERVGVVLDRKERTA